MKTDSWVLSENGLPIPERVDFFYFLQVGHHEEHVLVVDDPAVVGVVEVFSGGFDRHTARLDIEIKERKIRTYPEVTRAVSSPLSWMK